MPSRFSWLALGFGAYLAFAVATLPAATAYRWLAPDALRLAGVSGTVWSGAAALGSVPGLALHDLRWRVDAWPLLLGRLSGRFEARLPDGFVNADAVVTRTAVELSDVRASTSLPVLRDLLPIGDTQGLASAALQRLRLVGGFPAAAVGTLRVNDLEVAPLVAAQGSSLISLGSYEAQFMDGGGGSIAASIHDSGGPLEVAATLSLTPQRAYKLAGKLRPRPDASRDLVQGLTLMPGQADADGFLSFSLDGTL